MKRRSPGYGPAVLDHFRSPRNVGPSAGANAEGVAESRSCGDRVRLWLRVEAGVLCEVRFQAFGCVAAIASASAATVLFQGLPVEAAMAMDKRSIARYLGGLCPDKEPCAALPHEALRRALGGGAPGLSQDAGPRNLEFPGNGP